MNEGKIIKMFWISLGLDLLYFVLIIGVIIFQQPLKKIFSGLSGESSVFILFLWPLFSEAIRFVIHGVLTLVLVRRFRSGFQSIVPEVLGAFLLGGGLSWPELWGSYIFNIFYGYKGSFYLANASVVGGLTNFIQPVCLAGNTLFLLACGMSLFYKKYLSVFQS